MFDFDAGICRWGLMFAEDLVATLSSLRGLLRPGGCFAAIVWGPPERGRLEDVIPVVNVRKFEASTDDPRVAKEPPDLSWVSRRSDVKVLRFAAKQQVTYAPANEIRLVATAHEPGDDTQGILVNAVVRDIVCTHGLRLHIAGGLDRLGFDLAGAGLPSF